ncbi:O-antigen ligase family protein [Ursidibacter sp. B-7004-1]
MFSSLIKYNKVSFTSVINILVFLFYTTLLISQKSYNYTAMVLAAVALFFVLYRLFYEKQTISLSQDAKKIIYAFVAYFSTIALSVLVTNDGFREIDNPSRVLLFIPLILLFSTFPIRINTILYAIPTGSAIIGLMAIIQIFILGQEKPFPDHMHIQAGNISVTLAMMSLAISIYWGIKKQYNLMLICFICASLGMLASAFSGARGGWVGLPAIFAIILFFSYKHLNKKLTLVITFVLSILISGIVISPKTNVLNRIQIAQAEIINYFEHHERTSSLGARFDMWNSAVLGIQQKPLLGWGKNGYIELKRSQLEQNIIAEGTLKFNDAHNQYLDTTVKRGVLGLLGLLAVILIPLVYFISAIRNTSLEIKIIALLGIIHIISTVFFFTSQTFLAHNSGAVFYFVSVVILYGAIKSLQK